jgi:hypothetical protein
MSAATFSHNVLTDIGRSSQSPLWLRVVAHAAARADHDGVAEFDLMELRTLLRWQNETDPAKLGQAEASLSRARALGLVEHSVGLEQVQLAAGIRPIAHKPRPSARRG